MTAPISQYAARFWEKADRGDGCWVWRASRTTNGYGKFGVRARQIVEAHRVAWELTNGPIPVGLYVCHACDNRLCVRPDHLFLGTAFDNNADMTRKGRANRTGWRGRGNVPKLTPDDVRLIRDLMRAGATQRGLGRRFGVSATTIKNVHLGQTWKTVV